MKEIETEEKNYFYSLISYYLKKNLKVHIEVKDNNRFYNGMIVSVGDDMFILNDVVLGEMPVFFSQLKLAEVYKEKNE